MSPIAGYERRDASLRIVGFSAFVLVGLVGGSLLVSFWLYGRHYNHVASVGPRQTSFTEGPTERTGIFIDRATVQTEARSRLETYGWIDRSTGIVRLPIARAMELTASELSAATPKETSSP